MQVAVIGAGTLHDLPLVTVSTNSRYKIMSHVRIQTETRFHDAFKYDTLSMSLERYIKGQKGEEKFLLHHTLRISRKCHV